MVSSPAAITVFDVRGSSAGATTSIVVSPARAENNRTKSKVTAEHNCRKVLIETIAHLVEQA